MNSTPIWNLFVVLNSCLLVKANLDLFINHEEAQRLLGLKTTLFYFQAGEINHYATSFNITVPVNITELNFAWKGDNKSSIPYSILAETNDPKAMLPPRLNISSVGYIPPELQYWSVSALCTGKTTSEVFITLRVNVTLPGHKIPTSLVLGRIKICIKGEWPLESSLQDEIPIPQNNQTLFIIICNVCAVIVIIGLVAGYFWRNKKINHTVRLSRESTSSCRANHNGQTFFPGHGQSSPRLDNSGDYSSLKPCSSENPSTDSVSSAYGKKELDELLAALVVDFNDVKVRVLSAEGSYGKELEGVLQGSSTDKCQNILIKTVSSGASRGKVTQFLREGLTLYGACHQNIHAVIGVCVGDTVPVIVYPAFGMNLKLHLNRLSNTGSGLAAQDALAMCSKLCDGLQYLHHKAYLHGDLAARNCRIDPRQQVKISDCALSEDLFPGDYLPVGPDKMLPVRWCPLEVLEGHPKSTCSDVWAFGVLMWEIVTLGQNPYRDIEPSLMVSYLSKGYRLAQPVTCPDELFSMMAYCWTVSPLDRPSASQLLNSLRLFQDKLNRFV